MIILEPTPKYAGVILYGDYQDLTAFYETLHDLARQWTGAEQLGDMVLGLAYEVRKALELQREQKDFGRFALEKVRYRGCPLLWPNLMVQVQLLNQMLASSRGTKVHYAQLYHLEHQMELALLAMGDAIGKQCVAWLNTPMEFHDDYYVSFFEDIGLRYVLGPQGKARFKKLPGLLADLNPESQAYQDFAYELEAQAEQHGCSPHLLHSADEWPDFQW